MIIGQEYLTEGKDGIITYIGTPIPGFIVMVEALQKVYSRSSARVWLQVYGFKQHNSRWQQAYLYSEQIISHGNLL